MKNSEQKQNGVDVLEKGMTHKKSFRIIVGLMSVLFLIGATYLIIANARNIAEGTYIGDFQFFLFKIYTPIVLFLLPAVLMILTTKKIVSFKKYLVVVTPLVNILIFFFSLLVYGLLNPIHTEWALHLGWPYLIIDILLIPMVSLFYLAQIFHTRMASQVGDVTKVSKKLKIAAIVSGIFLILFILLMIIVEIFN